jgi:glycosyltransferase involved in cell wall biosynthesis
MKRVFSWSRSLTDAMLSNAVKASVQAAASPRRFDGVICFGGEDWWYHNRGHYDMQMMRRFSAHMPVLYVNSIGMRVPSPTEGRMFLNRVRRKLRSIRRGLVEVSDDFAVYSPLTAPGRLGMALGRALLARTVRRAARQRGIWRPLVWVACPTAAEAIDDLDPAAVVYQRTDRYECFRGVSTERISNYDGWLKARADLTVFCSTMLFNQEAGDCRRACCIDHGVDLERFVSASEGTPTEPPEIAVLPRPRVGFVGGIDAHTFDQDLFLETARGMPEAQFVLVGACSLPEGWCELPNVTLLGKRPYEQVPAYLAACDVLIMPWQRSPWIEACNPVKLKEYLAAGRPVVTTDFAELRRYEGLVRVATDAGVFARSIREVLVEPWNPRPARAHLGDQGWASKAGSVLSELESVGIVPRRRGRKGAAPSATDHHPPVTRRPVKHDPAPDPHPVMGPDPKPTNTLTAKHVDIAASILLAGGLRLAHRRPDRARLLAGPHRRGRRRADATHTRPDRARCQLAAALAGSAGVRSPDHRAGAPAAAGPGRSAAGPVPGLWAPRARPRRRERQAAHLLAGDDVGQAHAAGRRRHGRRQPRRFSRGRLPRQVRRARPGARRGLRGPQGAVAPTGRGRGPERACVRASGVGGPAPADPIAVPGRGRAGRLARGVFGWLYRTGRNGDGVDRDARRRRGTHGHRGAIFAMPRLSSSDRGQYCRFCSTWKRVSIRRCAPRTLIVTRGGFRFCMLNRTNGEPASQTQGAG